MMHPTSNLAAKPVHLVPPASGRSSPLAVRLRGALRGDVLFDAASRGRYSTDASIYQITPLGIVVPRDQQDLRAALDVARSEGAPVLARGAGTSQCGQTVAEALVVDTSKWLNNVVDFDRDARTVTVEPGIVLDHLNAWLKPHGLWFPVDVSTGAQCTIGGMAGNNSCGSRSIEYGNMVHNVAAIDALLADGTDAHFGPLGTPPDGARMKQIVDGLTRIARRERGELAERVPRVLRRVAGYNLDLFDCLNPRAYTDDGVPNLAHILVGAEGTLAFSRQLTLRLAPLPRHKTLGVVNFPTFYDAMSLTRHIVKLQPAAVELVDSTMIGLALDNPAFRPVIGKALVGEPDAILLVEFAGEDRDTQLARLGQLVELMGDLGLPGSVVEMPDAGEQKALWDVRKAGLNIMMSMKGDGKPVSFIEDCAVPLEHLAEYTARLTEVFHRHGTEGTWYAHASVGTLHVRPILDMRRDGAVKMRAIAEEASAMVREYKGAYSGEHGDGLCRGEWVAWQYGPKIHQAFTEIKALFDPDNRFNPDKIVRPPKMDDSRNFRFPPTYRELPVVPVLDWSAWNVKRDPLSGEETPPGTGESLSGGLAKAIEMCNNNGHCRKFDAGTMCPSYRVTRDEQHVTRGRANTLRLAVSGQLGDDGIASAEVKEVLDLCVSCKGCRRDCPTGVDMAKFKIEARAAWAKRHGLRLREKLIAFMPRYAAAAARVPALLAAADHVPFVSHAFRRALGLAPQRSLPRFRRPFLADAGARAAAVAAPAGAREVLLFVDTFNNGIEPGNARAAVRVLEAAGYTVRFNTKDGERPLCCGRTFLAAGLVDEARSEAQRMLDAFLPYVKRGVPIVGLEPSCLLSLRDEFLQYGYGEDARRVAQSAFLFEEFLVRENEAGRLNLPLRALDARVAWVHGHCHQKAFDAFRPVQTVLGWIPELDVRPIESSCCGMAGSFGYEAEHYETSNAMAELSLLPAVRQAGAGDLIVADGTSCRHQIHDGAQRDALHVARVLEMAL
ncbi:FAD-binding and (Fe-S)-binding domain-containing protein [Paraburkholderia caballeronis]|uniref:FAD-binding and (Fe-S)-binding domain-containing protein n=1 Tax=Paraburkholderia caballeronis TaxID=416943 RepID=UPI001066862A|nr:FAD-binding and (Fe-S)-binding domain-containing protein [Paraburkholderia caballeronis]TDV15802.1 FAD/FMN-containing dehydrogenase [Paraburkholderia caballeronis]TDV18057.1 FAD/FMN-containing dehydrogenase [Paraburkholderia caballeronis]TDV26329.1 FAD/FMN-containing dehydrogenase [Paraburkholderia caballeronis]